MKRKPIFVVAFLLLGSSLHAIPMEGCQKEWNPNNDSPSRMRMDKEARDRRASKSDDSRGGGEARGLLSEADDHSVQKAEERSDEPTAAVGPPPFSEDENGDLKGAIRNDIYTTCLAEVALSADQEFHSAFSKLMDSWQARQGAEKLPATPWMRFMDIAEKQWNAAQNADINARVAQSKAEERNFDQEFAAYQEAEHCWLKVVEAYKDALRECDFSDFKTALQEDLSKAELKAFLWASHGSWMEARKVEDRINTSKGDLTPNDIEEAADAWKETIEETEAVLEKTKNILFDSSEWTFRLDEAKARYAIWKRKLDELEKLSINIDPQQKAEWSLKKLNRQKRADDRAARNAIWSEENQRSYEKWTLLGEIVKPIERQERTSETIIEPLRLTSELEELGRKLLREEQRAAKATTSSNLFASIKEQQTLKVAATRLEHRAFADPEEEALLEITTAAFLLTPENERRITLRETADRLYAEAAMIVKAKLAQSEKAEKTTETDEQSTVLGSVAKSVFGWSPKHLSVVGSTISKSSSSSKSQEPPKILDPYEAATAAEEEWKYCVNQAETKRIQLGGIPLEDSVLLIDAWAKADRKALLAKKEREKIEKEKAIATKLKESWESNTTRWKARMLADQRDREAKVFEEKAIELENEKCLLQAEANVSTKRKQEAIMAAAVAVEEARKARATATKAEREWTQLASQHQSILQLPVQGDPSGALEKLKSSDQAVNALWIEVSNLYDEDEFKEPEDPELKQAREKKDAETYTTNLLIKRSSDIAACFTSVDTILLEAKRAYGKTFKSKAQDLYSSADISEIAAWENYGQGAKSDALQAARERISGAAEAWAHRMALSEQERVRQEQLSAKKSPAADPWADENQRALARATAIAVADEEAFKMFQREETRLNDIATLWIGIIEAQKRAAHEARKKAAKEYAAGDQTAWLALSFEEQSTYNREVAQANETYETAATEKVKHAEAMLKLARRTASETWNPFTRRSVLEAIEKATSLLSTMDALEEERQKAIHWGKLAELTPEKREMEWSKIKRSQENERANNRWLELSLQEKKAKIAQLKKSASEYYTKRDKAYKTGKTEEGNSWHNVGNSFYDAAAKQGKAIEAEQAGKPEVAIKWREAAERQLQAVEYFVKAAQARAAGKTEEGNSWNAAGLSFYNAAEAMLLDWP